MAAVVPAGRADRRRLLVAAFSAGMQWTSIFGAPVAAVAVALFPRAPRGPPGARHGRLRPGDTAPLPGDAAPFWAGWWVSQPDDVVRPVDVALRRRRARAA
ncbi:hypothetical protein QJS66_12655 [Kocuria rhizophila]|nr:hypothetical protein QJS66_12655 [Kocuria rhizophila]